MPENINKFELLAADFGNLYADALVADVSGSLIFASLYGRNSDVQALLAGLSLKTVRSLAFKKPGYSSYDERFDCSGLALEKMNKKVSRFNTPTFGVLLHLFLFNNDLNQMNYEAKSAYLLAKTEAQLKGMLWSTVCALSSIPLLAQWERVVLDEVLATSIYKPKTIGDIYANLLVLPEDFEARICALLKRGLLSVH